MLGTLLHRPMRLLPLCVIAMAVAALAACQPERKSFVPNCGEDVPTMVTDSVCTFISDSGYTRYRITTLLWQMFEDREEPFWRFPYGLELVQYDRQMRPTGNVVCDSAVYFSRMRLWRLDGHVVMVNTLRDTFLTEQVFWDQTRTKVYSDSFIHIVRSDRIIEGYGFESNQTMTAFSVNRPTGIFPVERRQQSAQADTVALDSADYFNRGRRSAPSRASERRPTPPFLRDNAGFTPRRPIKSSSI